VSGNPAAISVESYDDFLARKAAGQRAQKAKIDFPTRENSAANNDLRCADFNQLASSDDGADAAAYANLHFVLTAGAFTKLFH
jgi:hypothetical protein